MLFTLLGALSLLPLTLCTQPGHEPIFLSNQISTESKPAVTFGSHYAVLNLDLIDGIVANVNTTEEGKTWIKNTAEWIDA